MIQIQIFYLSKIDLFTHEYDWPMLLYINTIVLFAQLIDYVTLEQQETAEWWIPSTACHMKPSTKPPTSTLGQRPDWSGRPPSTRLSWSTTISSTLSRLRIKNFWCIMRGNIMELFILWLNTLPPWLTERWLSCKNMVDSSVGPTRFGRHFKWSIWSCRWEHVGWNMSVGAGRLGWSRKFILSR